jgi:hypothetical protein
VIAASNAPYQVPRGVEHWLTVGGRPCSNPTGSRDGAIAAVARTQYQCGPRRRAHCLMCASECRHYRTTSAVSRRRACGCNQRYLSLGRTDSWVRLS